MKRSNVKKTEELISKEIRSCSNGQKKGKVIPVTGHEDP
jgi:hypothetical protein